MANERVRSSDRSTNSSITTSHPNNEVIYFFITSPFASGTYSLLCFPPLLSQFSIFCSSHSFSPLSPVFPAPPAPFRHSKGRHDSLYLIESVRLILLFWSPKPSRPLKDIVTGRFSKIRQAKKKVTRIWVRPPLPHLPHLDSAGVFASIRHSIRGVAITSNACASSQQNKTSPGPFN